MSDPTPARRAAYEVLRRVFEHGAWANRALPAALQRHRVSAVHRALAQRLAYGSVQRRGTSDHLVSVLANRPPAKLDPPVLAALRLGIYELLFSEASPHAVVDQAVSLAKSSAGGRRGAGLVNAVLRRVTREGPSILGSLEDDDPERAAIRHSYPLWICELWWQELGRETALSLLEAGNRPAETALRANRMRASRDEVIAELAAAGVDASPAPGPAPLDAPESLVVSGPLGDRGTATIAAGRAVAQSRASAAAVAVLDPQPGDRVLDLCAGPGVKTTQIAARMADRGEVRAVELRSGRASQVRELCARLGTRIVEVLVGDAAESDLGSGYDRVLVDPPCSDLGTLSSRPDARWRKRPDDPVRLAEIQRAILARGASALAPGGTLVYSTCTISARENEAVVAEALADAGPSSLLRADPLGERFGELVSEHDRRFLQIRPDRHRTDGFFVARLRRQG